MNHTENNSAEFSKNINEEFEKIRKNIKRPNILVCGGTGAGKSSLINMAITDPKAPVGSGRPVTQEIAKYEGELVVIYDSPGYESGDDNMKIYKDKVLKLIQNNKNTLNERIHLVWYCISQGNDRILDIDTKTINDIKQEGTPIVIVLTQADKGSEESSNELKKELTKSCPSIEILETSEDKSLGMGIESLIDWSINNLDAALRDTFIAGANSIKHKQSEGEKIVLEHILVASGIAVSPIPFSDAILLTGNQATLIARLAHLWDFSAAKNLITNILPGSLVSNLGKSAAGNIIKIVPGWGSTAGAVINSGVASVITAGIGYGLNTMFSYMAKDNLAGKKSDLQKYLEMLPSLIDMFSAEYRSENK